LSRTKDYLPKNIFVCDGDGPPIITPYPIAHSPEEVFVVLNDRGVPVKVQADAVPARFRATMQGNGHTPVRYILGPLGGRVDGEAEMARVAQLIDDGPRDEAVAAVDALAQAHGESDSGVVTLRMRLFGGSDEANADDGKGIEMLDGKPLEVFVVLGGDGDKYGSFVARARAERQLATIAPDFPAGSCSIERFVREGLVAAEDDVIERVAVMVATMVFEALGPKRRDFEDETAAQTLARAAKAVRAMKGGGA
jgi:hypothetical protein